MSKDLNEYIKQLRKEYKGRDSDSESIYFNFKNKERLFTNMILSNTYKKINKIKGRVENDT